MWLDIQEGVMLLDHFGRDHFEINQSVGGLFCFSQTSGERLVWRITLESLNQCTACFHRGPVKDQFGEDHFK